MYLYEEDNGLGFYGEDDPELAGFFHSIGHFFSNVGKAVAKVVTSKPARYVEGAILGGAPGSLILGSAHPLQKIAKGVIGAAEGFVEGGPIGAVVGATASMATGGKIGGSTNLLMGGVGGGVGAAISPSSSPLLQLNGLFSSSAGPGLTESASGAMGAGSSGSGGLLESLFGDVKDVAKTMLPGYLTASMLGGGGGQMQIPDTGSGASPYTLTPTGSAPVSYDAGGGGITDYGPGTDQNAAQPGGTPAAVPADNSGFTSGQVALMSGGALALLYALNRMKTRTSSKRIA